MATNANPLPNPARHKSPVGHCFLETDHKWELDRNTTVNVQEVRDLLYPDLHNGFISTLAHYARTLSGSHTQNISRRFLSMFQTLGSGAIDVTSLIKYRATLDRSTEWYLSTIRGFLYAWHALGYPGISDDVVDLLDSWTMKGNIKGDAVKRLDPNKGPLTTNELRAFNDAVVRGFETNLVSLAELGMALLLSNAGRRPIQICHMKAVDVVCNGRNIKGEAINILRIPRAKQQDEGFRGSFKLFAVTDELWTILQAQRTQCITAVEACLGQTLEEGDQLALPLFLDMEAIEQLMASGNDLRAALETDHLHLPSKVVTRTLRKIVKLTSCRSERTGDLLNIFSTRFRYTVGTRAAREGLGPMIIAEILDHTDTQQVSVYSTNVPENAAILDMKIGSLMAAYANAFQGIIVDRESDASRGDDLCSRVRYRGEGTGVCGTYGYCGANVPIPCYTCPYFQALLDGPHEEVLFELLVERERIFAKTGDQMLATANDQTILAVKDTIERCRRRREDIQKGQAD